MIHILKKVLIRQKSQFKNFILIRTKLEFALVIWAQQSRIHLDSIKKIQNKFLRYLYYKKYRVCLDYIDIKTSLLKKQFVVRSLINKRKQSMILFFYEIVYNHIKCMDYLLLKRSRTTTHKKLTGRHFFA